MGLRQSVGRLEHTPDKLTLLVGSLVLGSIWFALWSRGMPHGLNTHRPPPGSTGA